MTDRVPSDDGGDREAAHATTYEWEGGTTPSVQLVEAVADATDCDPTTLPTLQDAVDVDALDTVLTGSRGDVLVRFEYANRTVVIRSAGRITVRS